MDAVEKKTSVATFRLPDPLLEQLRSEAIAERISLNTLVNQVLHRHAEWDVYVEKMGMINLGEGPTKPS